VLDSFGMIRTIQTRALYVPNCSQRLLSPQAYIQDLHRLNPEIKYNSKLTGTEFQLNENDQLLFNVPLDQWTNLPTSRAYRSRGILQTNDHLNLCVTDAANQNITASQKELYRWHSFPVCANAIAFRSSGHLRRNEGLASCSRQS
jgi:hypothetical protein